MKLVEAPLIPEEKKEKRFVFTDKTEIENIGIFKITCLSLFYLKRSRSEVLIYVVAHSLQMFTVSNDASEKLRTTT